MFPAALSELKVDFDSNPRHEASLDVRPRIE